MDKIPYPVASSKSSVTFLQFLKHPIIIIRGLILAHRLKCQFIGAWQCGAIEFHDHISGGGFTLMPGAQTIWHARGKLLGLRKSFYPTKNDKICDGSVLCRSLVTPSPTQRSRHVRGL
jgi:hypothetical protein